VNARPEYRARGAANQDVTSADRRPTTRPPAGIRHPASPRFERAGSALLETIRAARRLQRAVADFRTANQGLDQADIVHAAASQMSGAKWDEARCRELLWQEAARLFHWVDLARVEPRGRA
jgi:hypothetical protein